MLLLRWRTFFASNPLSAPQEKVRVWLSAHPLLKIVSPIVFAEVETNVRAFCFGSVFAVGEKPIWGCFRLIFYFIFV